MNVIYASFAFFVIDILYINFVASTLYKCELKDIQNKKMGVENILSGISAYVLLILGFVIFIVPILEDKNDKYKILKAAMFGIVVYGVYTFTCKTIIKDWSWTLVFTDIVWGSFIYFMVSAIYLGLNQLEC